MLISSHIWQRVRVRCSSVFNNKEMWTHSPVFRSPFCCLIPIGSFFLFYLGSKGSVPLLEFDKWHDLSVLSGQCERALLHLYSPLAWKVPLFSLLLPPLRPMRDRIIMSVGEGMACLCISSHTLFGGISRIGLNGTLPSSCQTAFSPHLQRRARALRDTIVSVPSTPTNTKSQGGNKGLGPQRAYWESHLCVHSEELFTGNVQLDLHQTVTFHTSV